MGRFLAARAAAAARRRDDGLPRFGPLGPPPEARRDERASARDGGGAELRPVQPRPPDLCGIEVERYRKAVRAKVMLVVPAFAGTTSRLPLESPIPYRRTPAARSPRSLRAR